MLALSTLLHLSMTALPGLVTLAATLCLLCSAEVGGQPGSGGVSGAVTGSIPAGPAACTLCRCHGGCCGAQARTAPAARCGGALLWHAGALAVSTGLVGQLLRECRYQCRCRCGCASRSSLHCCSWLLICIHSAPIARSCGGTVDDPYGEFMVQENTVSTGNCSVGHGARPCCVPCAARWLCLLLLCPAAVADATTPAATAGHWPRVAHSRQPVRLLARALDAAACL